MKEITNYFIVLTISYLIGSIPIGLLISKILKDDVRKHGSGNIGSTNMTRAYGKKIGKITFAFDFFKGLLVFLIFKYLYITKLELFTLSQIVVVFGHCFSIFLKFKGGKGVATTIAISALNNWILTIFLVLIWLVLFYSTKIVSLSSICSLIIVCILAWISYFKVFNLNVDVYAPAILVNTIIVILTHKDNIKRLLNGTENTFKKTK